MNPPSPDSPPAPEAMDRATTNGGASEETSRRLRTPTKRRKSRSPRKSAMVSANQFGPGPTSF